MSFSLNVESGVYAHHDLMMEIGRVELAMEHLDHRSETERSQLRPRLESRMHRLREKLQELPA
jgi:hypothetical protein